MVLLENKNKKYIFYLIFFILVKKQSIIFKKKLKIYKKLSFLFEVLLKKTKDLGNKRQIIQIFHISVFNGT